MRPAAAVAVALLALGSVGCEGGDDASAVPAESTDAVPEPTIRSTATSISAPSATAMPGATTTVPTTAATTAATTTATASTATADGPTGPQVLGSLGSTEIVIDTGEGSVQIGAGTVPAAAADVPVPPGLDVELATEASGTAGYSGASPQAVAELAAFYATELPQAGFEITEDRPAGSSRFIAFRGDGGVGQIAISPAPGGDGSTIVVAFGPPA